VKIGGKIRKDLIWSKRERSRRLGERINRGATLHFGHYDLISY
jgi:hypothetical protein